MSCNSRAHPRSRGEHWWTGATHKLHYGSSPLTRGARAYCLRREYARGLIPAHAGSTGTADALPAHPRAHPRSRGEHDAMQQFKMTVAGSSPLTRGAPVFSEARFASIGLIPAHAGSTSPYVVISDSWAAHPRSRGEHVLLAGHFHSAEGSSPLTRGAPNKHECPLAPGGLIPAHAGSTWPA